MRASIHPFDSSPYFLNDMPRLTIVRPIIASVLAGAVACWPILLTVGNEILTSYGLLRRADWGDDFHIGVNLALLVYPFAVVCSFVIGQALLLMGLSKVRSFILTSSVIALLTSYPFLFIGYSSTRNPSIWDRAFNFSKIFAVVSVSFSLAAFCWWYIAARPYKKRIILETAIANEQRLM